MKKIELLSPVGTEDALYAAVANGANAVYLGGKLFNARHYASNFSNEELEKAVKYCQLRNVKLYVTVNILLDDGEVEEALDYTKYLYDIGVDGVIVQDIGYGLLVRKLLPELEVHGSTQMSINNLEGAQFLYEKGFTRVVLSRELGPEEIRYIAENCPIELEVFIHGALCVSYSGQCLMSSMIGGRSGNRGRCAQPCRMPSSLINEELSFEAHRDRHILSPKDLNTVEEIEGLVEAGVTSYKIEGRMKRPEYVATVTKIYRKALDLGSQSITSHDREDLRQIFNRGFTSGLGFGDFGEEFISIDRPDNRGILIGQVIDSRGTSVVVRLDKDVKSGDGIEFKVGENKYKGMKISETLDAGNILEVPKIGNISRGSNVYRTSSMALLEAAEKSYTQYDYKEEIDLEVEVALGEYPKLTARYLGEEVEIIGDSLVEKSQKLPLTEDIIYKQLSKLGDTIYEIRDFKLTLGQELFLAKSVLNGLRRELTDRLDQVKLRLSRTKLDQAEFEERKRAALIIDKNKELDSKKLAIKVENIEILRQLNLEELDRVYLNYYEDIEELKESLDYLSDYNGEIFLATEKILSSQDLEVLKTRLEEFGSELTGVTANNLGTLQVLKDYDLKIHGDIGLNIFNSYSLRAMEGEGVLSQDLSPELTLDQIEKIGRMANIEISSIAYGYIPVMTMKHCPMSLVKGCKDDSQCKTCKFKEGYSIRDRIGAEFKFTRKTGFTSVYNTVPIFVLDSMDRIKKSVNIIRMDLTFEASDKIKDLQENYYKSINGIDRSEVNSFVDEFRRTEEITRGHYFRGIMD